MTAEESPRRRARHRLASAIAWAMILGGVGLGAVAIEAWHTARQRTQSVGVVSQVGSPRVLQQAGGLVAMSGNAPPEVDCDYEADFSVGGVGYVVRGTLANPSTYQLTPLPRCRYAVGDPIDVFYDPGDPSVSTLLSVPVGGEVVLGLSSVLLVGGGTVGMAGFRRVSPPE